MNKLAAKVLKTLKFVRGFFPKRLPTGLKDFDAFAAMIFDVYNLPALPSYKHAVASMIMHLGPTTAYKAPWFFAISVKKAMANQTAFEIIQQIKEAEKAQQLIEAEKQTQPGEATPEQAIAVNDPLPVEEVQAAPKKLVRKAKG